jgi:hypothetical protein
LVKEVAIAMGKPGKAKSKPRHYPPAPDCLPVDASKIRLGNSYSAPPAYYRSRPFTCKDCGVEEIWTAAQQKWWYEEAGGYFFATAIRCRPCRQQERQRKAEARRIHHEGLVRKHQVHPQTIVTPNDGD